jgi:hypothetical protein
MRGFETEIVPNCPELVALLRKAKKAVGPEDRSGVSQEIHRYERAFSTDRRIYRGRAYKAYTIDLGTLDRFLHATGLEHELDSVPIVTIRDALQNEVERWRKERG